MQITRPATGQSRPNNHRLEAHATQNAASSKGIVLSHRVIVTVGNLPIAIRCDSGEFVAMLRERYGDFAVVENGARIASGTLTLPSATEECGRGGYAASRSREIELDVELIEPSSASADDDLRVSFGAGQWLMRRGDFFARWDPASGRGLVRQAAYPYAIDSVMRIIHSLVLAESGGFLLHSASAIRNGRAFLFTGVSGAGKTTISRLAPPDATLLTDEISYVRRIDGEYRAFGTPFAGELGIPGKDIAAPIAALYFLRKGDHNHMAPVDTARAAAMALRNVLFFAGDAALGERLFGTVCDFVARVPLHHLTFKPEAALWDLIL
jgi:hypothetical protein